MLITICVATCITFASYFQPAPENTGGAGDIPARATTARTIDTLCTPCPAAATTLCRDQTEDGLLSRLSRILLFLVHAAQAPLTDHHGENLARSWGERAFQETSSTTSTAA
jgi:hypothetical protein